MKFPLITDIKMFRELSDERNRAAAFVISIDILRNGGWAASLYTYGK